MKKEKSQSKSQTTQPKVQETQPKVQATQPKVQPDAKPKEFKVTKADVTAANQQRNQHLGGKLVTVKAHDEVLADGRKIHHKEYTYYAHPAKPKASPASAPAAKAQSDSPSKAEAKADAEVKES